MEINHWAIIRAHQSEQNLVSSLTNFRIRKNFKKQGFEDPSQERHTNHKAIRICVSVTYFNIVTKVIVIDSNQ